jgi:uncharacterized protein (TIGR02145 family)/uncharacterized repeat protein (TIGR02543 family)
MKKSIMQMTGLGAVAVMFCILYITCNDSGANGGSGDYRANEFVRKFNKPTTGGGKDSSNVVTPPISKIYTITFDANGGTVSPTSVKTGADGKLTNLPTPTRGNDTFNGWFTDMTGNTNVTKGTEFSGDTTIYAQWTVVPTPPISNDTAQGKGKVLFEPTTEIFGNVGEWFKITVKVMVGDTVNTTIGSPKVVGVYSDTYGLVFSASQGGADAMEFPLNKGVATFWISSMGTMDIFGACITVTVLVGAGGNAVSDITQGNRCDIYFTKPSSFNDCGDWGGWGAWDTTAKATCDATGLKTRTCTINNSQTETEVIPKETGAACTPSSSIVYGEPLVYGDQTYTTVVIADKTWMAENLNIETDNSWCYGNADSNCVKYGRLYDWETAKKACSDIDGWYLPSRDEWYTLVSAVGISGLKSTSGWYGGGSNESGFSALPGGYRPPTNPNDTNGYFAGAGNYGIWWTATENYADKYNHVSYNISDSIVKEMGGANSNSNGYSVRCVKDE